MYSQEKISQIIETIKESIQPDKIYLFGSYAYGNPKENSDLDICIIKNNFKDKQQELLKAKKSIFNIGGAMDILLFNGIDFSKRQDIWGSVQYEVSHKGIKVYER